MIKLPDYHFFMRLYETFLLIFITIKERSKGNQYKSMTTTERVMFLYSSQSLFGIYPHGGKS